MKLIITVGLLLTALTIACAQPIAKQSEVGAHLVPFASESNRIELQIVNSTGASLEQVSVQLGAVPMWLTFEEASVQIGDLEPGTAQTAVLTFDLDEKAPVGEVGILDFEVQTAAGVLETRTIRIEPEAPTELMLRGNYPNPFNPTTKIAYALPKDGYVEIEIFNPIGQRVGRVVDQIQAAGYQEISWNASTFPSGVYFYSVRLDDDGTRQVKVGKMLLVR